MKVEALVLSSVLRCLGFVMYLSYGTRSSGVLLLPSLVVYELIRWRRISACTFISIGVFFFWAVIQGIFFHNDGYYFNLIRHNVENSFAFAVRDNFHSFTFFWANDGHPKIQIVLFLSSMFLALSGFIMQVRRRVLVTEIFFTVYCASILFWPAGEGIRYFVPMLPLFIFYLLCGVEYWASKPVPALPAVLRSVILIGLLGFLVFSYGSRYRSWDYRTIAQGPYQWESRELFQFVRKKTPLDAVFIFRKPRILALFTGRQASAYQRPANQEELWKYMRGIDASYLIYAQPLSNDKNYLSLFIQRYQKQLKLVFINKDFQVFKIIE